MNLLDLKRVNDAAFLVWGAIFMGTWGHYHSRSIILRNRPLLKRAVFDVFSNKKLQKWSVLSCMDRYDVF